jgi:hypothetical protein
MIDGIPAPGPSIFTKRTLLIMTAVCGYDWLKITMKEYIPSSKST